MDIITKNKTKNLIFRDFRRSGLKLGDFALEWMNEYDDICFELKLKNCSSHGKPVQGTAILASMEMVEEFIGEYEIEGDYTINLVDTQKQFFLILEEIKDELDHEGILEAYY